MRSGNFQVCRSSLQAASDRIFSKLLGKNSIFPDCPDFGIVLILDLVFYQRGLKLPVVAILPQGWLHLFEDLVKQLDLLVLLPANRNFFSIPSISYCKVAKSNKMFKICAL